MRSELKTSKVVKAQGGGVRGVAEGQGGARKTGLSIGLDVGGTKIAGVVMRRDGHVVAACKVKTGAVFGREFVVNRMLHCLRFLAREVESKALQDEVAGVGIGIPGVVPWKGALGEVPNIPSFSGFDVRRRFLSLGRVVVGNDADCFTLAEARLGVARGVQNVLGVTWGTGVGGGLVIGGNLLRARSGVVGEIGHVVLDPSWPLRSGLGVRGSVESIAGGKFMLKRYAALAGRRTRKRDKRVFERVDALWERGGAGGRKVVLTAVDALGRVLGGLASVLGLDLIVVGGSVSDLPVISELEARVRSYAHPSARKVRVVRSRLGGLAGALGAALLLFEHEEAVQREDAKVTSGSS
ncbi:ROK family protein [Candidatus Woesearchaeota archaeon]|nr:MAG: ROK family protein [Candidatus Woesearchaeota archaeon]